VPYSAHGETVRSLKADLVGKTLVLDITVPLAPPKVRQVAPARGQGRRAGSTMILGDGRAVVAALIT